MPVNPSSFGRRTGFVRRYPGGAGYEDVNDADRLGRDPAMRWIVGGKAVERGGASTSQMGRFETELLANNENLAATDGVMSWYRWSNVTRDEPSASTSAAMRPSPHRRSTTTSKPKACSTPSGCPPTRCCKRAIAHLLKRPVGRPPKDVRRYHASFSYQAGTWDKPRRVVAKVEWHPGELYPRVGFIVTNLGRPAERVVAFYNQRGTAEQWIKEGKNAIRWTRLSCRRFDHNAVRLQLHALAYNLGNFMRTLALPDAVEQWSLTSLREKLIKIAVSGQGSQS